MLHPSLTSNHRCHQPFMCLTECRAARVLQQRPLSSILFLVHLSGGGLFSPTFWGRLFETRIENLWLTDILGCHLVGNFVTSDGQWVHLNANKGTITWSRWQPSCTVLTLCYQLVLRSPTNQVFGDKLNNSHTSRESIGWIVIIK